MIPALIAQLETRHGIARLTQDNFQTFINSHQHVLLFFCHDVQLFPESLDLAVILPELQKTFARQLRAALVDKSIERELQARFRFTSWPSLVLLRNNEYLGVITGIQDWQTYRSEIARILALEPSQPPGFDLDKVCGAIQ